MALVVEKDEPLDPTDIGLFGHVAIVARADRLPDLIKEPEREHPRRGDRKGFWSDLTYRPEPVITETS